MRLMLSIALALCTFAAGAAPPLPGADPTVLLDGRTRGEGRLRILFGKARPFRVESAGRMRPDGVFRLDQQVTFEGRATESRHWLVRRTGAGRYAFMLSDAAGPGTAVVEGARLTLRYPLRRGMHVRQVLVPSADGRSIANTGSIRWFGLPIGRLTETITRVGERRVDPGVRTGAGDGASRPAR